jgi:hypothetical protein
MSAELLAQIVDAFGRRPGPHLVALAPSGNAPALPGNGAQDVDAIAERAARDPVFSAALCAALAQHRPSPESGNAPLLDNAPPVPFSNSLSPPLPVPIPNDLSALTSELVSKIVPYRKSSFLGHLTLTAPPHLPIAPLLDLSGVLGAWLVIVATAEGQHLHGLLVCETEEQGRQIPVDHAARHDLSPEAQDLQPVRGRSAEALRKSIFYIVRYDLKLGAHSAKRAREVPIATICAGVFSGLEGSARFALVTPEAIPASVTGPTLCECLCGKPASPGSRYAGKACSNRLRQRKFKARHAVKPVTASGYPVQAVTSPAREASGP